MDAIKNEIHEVTRMTLFHIQVCSSGTEEEALAWVRQAAPAGTTNNWQLDSREQATGVRCANGGGKMHYLFVC